MLQGKRILVTGAASGIGAACARNVADHGGEPILSDIDEMGLHRSAEGLGAVSATMDITNSDMVEATIRKLEDEVGPIDGLLHAAGVLQRPLPPEKLSMREWDIVNTVDLRGTYVVATAVGKRMAVRGSGSMVLIASVGGLCSGPLHAYGPAKAGVIAIAASLAAEWGPCNVRVNALSPGFTSTPALKRGVDSGMMNVELMSKASALQRLLEVDEIAAPATFLLSDSASGITGANLLVDAGYLCGTPWQGFGGLSARH